jgi:hypothetical protein
MPAMTASPSCSVMAPRPRPGARRPPDRFPTPGTAGASPQRPRTAAGGTAGAAERAVSAARTARHSAARSQGGREPCAQRPVGGDDAHHGVGAPRVGRPRPVLELHRRAHRQEAQERGPDQHGDCDRPRRNRSPPGGHVEESPPCAPSPGATASYRGDRGPRRRIASSAPPPPG